MLKLQAYRGTYPPTQDTSWRILLQACFGSSPFELLWSWLFAHSFAKSEVGADSESSSETASAEPSPEAIAAAAALAERVEAAQTEFDDIEDQYKKEFRTWQTNVRRAKTREAQMEMIPFELLWSWLFACLLYTSPSPRDRQKSRMPSSA